MPADEDKDSNSEIVGPDAIQVDLIPVSDQNDRKTEEKGELLQVKVQISQTKNVEDADPRVEISD